MLSVLAFKKSLFAGVLDGGETEVFMHGTRLSKFMESVDKVTGAMGEAKAGVVKEEAVEAVGAELEVARDMAQIEVLREDVSVAPEDSSAAPAARDPWAPLIDIGLKFAESLGAARTTIDNRDTDMPWRIETDDRTGKPYLKLPIPEADTLQRFADALAGLLARSGRR